MQQPRGARECAREDVEDATLQALGVKVKRWGAVLIDSAVCGVVTGLTLNPTGL